MSHHRQHVIEWLDKASNQLTSGQHAFAEFLLKVERPSGMPDSDWELRLQWMREVSSSFVKAQRAIVTVMAKIGDDTQPVEILDEIRRLVNQPNKEGARSTAYHFFWATRPLAYLGGLEPAEPLNLALIRGIEAWDYVDRTIWHINDAIREEIYEDPAFGDAQ